MALKDYNYSIERATRAFTKLSDEKVKSMVRSMTISDYAALASAFGFGDDEGNEQEVRRIIDKYLYQTESLQYPKAFSFKAIFESTENYNDVEELEESFLDFIRSSSIKELYEADIFGNLPEYSHSLYRVFLPKVIREAYDATKGVDPIKLASYVFESEYWDLKESLTYSRIRDLAIMKHIVENSIMDPKLKTEISKISGSAIADVKKPSVVNAATKTSDEVIGADSKTGMVVTKDKNEKVTVHDMKNRQNKDNLTLDSITESIDQMKRLAGLS